MKFIIVFAALFAVALAGPVSSDADAQVLRSDADVRPEGFNYALETSNGIQESAQGELKNVGSENEAISVRGSYSWTDPEGQVHTINYIADENGYQPEGADVPVAPQA